MRTLLLEHRLDLASRAAVDARGSPLGLPVLKEFVLLIDGLKPSALERCRLGMSNRIFYSTLSIWIPHTGRVGHDAVVAQRCGVDRIEPRLVQVRLDDPFLEVIQDNVLRAATEVTPGLFMQLCPHLLAGFPDDTAEAAP